jgi:hypothetical protein
MAHCYYHALSSVRKWGGVVEDLGTIPSFADWGRLITPQDWMLRGHRLDEPMPLGTVETGAGGAFSGGLSPASGGAFVIEI